MSPIDPHNDRVPPPDRQSPTFGLRRTEARSAFPRNAKVGMRFEGTGEESGETRVYTITAIDGDRVEVDGNHPYAGRTLQFRCTVRDVRKATAEEISHGHVHGPGGHHH